MSGIGYQWQEMKTPVLRDKELKKETPAQWAVVWVCALVCLTGL
jgi:hypothetical protein